MFFFLKDSVTFTNTFKWSSLHRQYYYLLFILSTVQCLLAEIHIKNIGHIPRPSISTFVTDCLNIFFVVYTYCGI